MVTQTVPKTISFYIHGFHGVYDDTFEVVDALYFAGLDSASVAEGLSVGSDIPVGTLVVLYDNIGFPTKEVDFTEHEIIPSPLASDIGFKFNDIQIFACIGTVIAKEVDEAVARYKVEILLSRYYGVPVDHVPGDLNTLKRGLPS